MAGTISENMSNAYSQDQVSITNCVTGDCNFRTEKGTSVGTESVSLDSN